MARIRNSQEQINEIKASNAEKARRAKARADQQKSVRANQSINTGRLSYNMQQAVGARDDVRRLQIQREAEAILGAPSQHGRAAAGKADATQQRKFRNEQRNIGRDITATKREMKKATRGSLEYNNLDARLRSLESLRNRMKASVKSASGTSRNPLSTRLEALIDYVSRFKGAKNLQESKRRVTPARKPVDADMMIDRTVKANGLQNPQDLTQRARSNTGIPEATTKQLEDMELELQDAASRYDSDEIKRIIRLMENMVSNMLYNSGVTPTNRGAVHA